MNPHPRDLTTLIEPDQDWRGQDAAIPGGDLIDLIALNRKWEIEDALALRKKARLANHVRSLKAAITRRSKGRAQLNAFTTGERA